MEGRSGGAWRYGLTQRGKGEAPVQAEGGYDKSEEAVHGGGVVWLTGELSLVACLPCITISYYVIRLLYVRIRGQLTYNGLCNM
jgi:hypothetical protein